MFRDIIVNRRGVQIYPLESSLGLNVDMDKDIYNSNNNNNKYNNDTTIQ